jgi:Protein of unknown function (DUF3108)
MKWKSQIFLLIISSLFFLYFKPEAEKEAYKYTIASNKIFQVGEELDYEVSYSFIKLGSVKIIVNNKKIVNGKTYYSAEAFIDSYSGIPFVNLHQIYESTISKGVYSVFFKGLVRSDDYTSYTDYTFNYDSSKVRIQKGKVEPHEVWTDSTASIHKKYQDGLSIFYYARANIGEDTSEDVPCFVKEIKGITKINFYNKITEASIDAVNYKISCYKVDGDIKFISIFGLTGYFEGWFTADSASIPVLAKMKVIIGSISIQLKSWKREGWMPPKYAEN